VDNILAGARMRAARRKDYSMGHSILVVDDDRGILDCITQLLEDEGYKVVACANGYAALEQARRETPSLALIDLLMPGMDGATLIGHLRAELGESPPILMMSASANYNYVRALPIQGFLGKPFDLDDLLGHIARYAATPLAMPGGRLAELA
jgi:chemosensory pili system protein ChpA (sensor histidine kinase/response regulator)